MGEGKEDPEQRVLLVQYDHGLESGRSSPHLNSPDASLHRVLTTNLSASDLLSLRAPVDVSKPFKHPKASVASERISSSGGYPSMEKHASLPKKRGPAFDSNYVDLISLSLFVSVPLCLSIVFDDSSGRRYPHHYSILILLILDGY